MISSLSRPNQRFLVPEVVQTSAMDCGPATLKALLEGFGIPVSYGRLREACQTSVDGTSIDTIEEVAIQLGLVAEQIMIPADHLLLPSAEALPAIVVVRQPNGLTHFVLAWNTVGPFVQVMDPATGRRWPTKSHFLDELFFHTFPVPADAWREWAGTPDFCRPLVSRLEMVGVDGDASQNLVENARTDSSWLSLARLDAATRLTQALVTAKGLEKGDEAATVLEQFYRQPAPGSDAAEMSIPAPYWSVVPADDPNDETAAVDTLQLHGAVLVRVAGLAADRARPESPETEIPDETYAPVTAGPLSPELLAALKEPPTHPEATIFQALKADGLLVPGALIVSLALASGAVLIEALLLRGILDIGLQLNLVGQRIGFAVAIILFACALLLLEWPLASVLARVGRRFETRLRITFLEKIPLLGDRYFRSRLTSDMTQRAHDLRQLRGLPNLGASFLRLCFQTLFTAIGVIWLDPVSAPLALLATAFAVGLTLATQPILSEQDMRLRAHLGALGHFYLDALLGLLPIRTHSAERSVRREHEGLLVEWIRANHDFYQVQTVVQALQAVVGSGFAVWILFHYVSSGGEASGALLLFFWALNLPALGQSLASTAQQYPVLRNRLLRLLEPLGAADETVEAATASASAATGIPTHEAAHGIAVTMQNVTVQAGGHVILQNINIDIKPGEHVAIVGPSGAGKSSLVGLLLGWHRPAQGSVLTDGELLTGARLRTLRRHTVWVDPAVQLWNETLLDNLWYGNEQTPAQPITLDTAIHRAGLFNVLERLPHGLQTQLGEGGGLVSGGEGQRVRLGRGLLRSPVQLVILDEPFRGLDRRQRTDLLREARQHWQPTTLLFISHDVGETKDFDRVILIEEGSIVENDTPETLLRRDSRYRQMLTAEEQVRNELWGDSLWRRLWMVNGLLAKTQADAERYISLQKETRPDQ